MGGHLALWMGIFHTDFGAIAIVPKFWCNGSVDALVAMNGFFFTISLDVTASQIS